jgi:hypothetical protein
MATTTEKSRPKPRPVARPVATGSKRECNCPEFCELDHDND